MLLTQADTQATLLCPPERPGSFFPMVCPNLPAGSNTSLFLSSLWGTLCSKECTDTQAPFRYLQRKKAHSWLETQDTCLQTHISLQPPGKSHKAPSSPSNLDRQNLGGNSSPPTTP